MAIKTKRILATATYTLKVINDGAQGPQGPQGPQGEVKDQYDSSFMEGKTFWSTSHDRYEQHGSNVTIEKEETSTMGGNVFQAQNETWAFSKNKIAIEENKIYKFKIRARQIQDALTGSDKSKLYAGATTYNALGDKISTSNGTYFVANEKLLSVSEGWVEITTYMSTKARDELIGVDKEVLCPAVKAFDTGTKSIKPMFLVNYQKGDGIAQVDYLTVEDYTQEWNALNLLKDKLNNDSQEVFDALTDNGRIQGIYIQDGQLYVNGQYINARNLRVIDNDDTLTLGIDEEGNVTLRAKTLEIGGKTVASQDDVSTSIDNIQIGGRNLIPNTDFHNELIGWEAINEATELIIGPGRFNETAKSAQAKLGNVANSGIKSPEGECASISSHIVSCWVKCNKACNFRLSIKFKNLEQELLNSDIISPYKSIGSNTWTYIEYKFNSPELSNSFYITGDIETPLGEDAILNITELKAEEGNKATTWSPAPEDIDESKIDIGGAIADVNNSNGQIQYPKLNIKGMISFTDFDENLSKHYIVKRNEEGEAIETTINGGMLETGSVKADKMSMYNLSVIRRQQRPHNEGDDANCDLVGDHVHWEDLDTSFNIDDQGHIKASGTFSSFNFNEVTKDKGWQINENGDSVFNNTLVRGTVELPQAGMTDYGSKGNNNLLRNSNFRNGALFWESVWHGCGVDKEMKFEEALSWKLIKTNEKFEDFTGTGQTIYQNKTIPAKKSYTYSGYYFVKDKRTIDMSFGCGLQAMDTNTDNSYQIIGEYLQWDATNCVEGKWTYFSHTVTTEKEFNKLYFNMWVQLNGAIWFSKLKVEEDNVATPWTAHLDEQSKSLRFWSGASFENRLDAPFQVLQDGTVKATKGEFGGTFTGKLEIGNIKIYDTNSSPGVIEIKNANDIDTIVRIAEDESFFGSQLSFGKLEGKKFKSYIKYNTSQNRLDVLQGGSIDFGNTNNKKISIKNDSLKGACLKFGNDILFDGEGNSLNIHSEQENKINISIGNFKDDSNQDDATLIVDGNIQTTSLNISMVKIYETPDKDGIDFFIE